MKELIENSLATSIPDVVLLCETWLNPFSPDINITGYETYRNNRTGRKGGGVAILTSTRLRQKLIQTKQYDSFESLFVEILVNPTKKLGCGSIYRPPNTELDKFLTDYDQMVSEIKKTNTNVVIGLDHNLDFLKASLHKNTQRFIEMNLEQGIFPTITRPTCMTKSTATLIDNILVSQNFCGKFESNIILDDISDHLLTALTLREIFVYKKDKVMITS